MISYSRYVAALHSIFCVFVCMCVPYKLEVVVLAQRGLGTEVLKGSTEQAKNYKECETGERRRDSCQRYQDQPKHTRAYSCC